VIKKLNEYALQTVPRRENIATLGARQNAGYEQKKAVIQRAPLIDSQRPTRDSQPTFPNGSRPIQSGLSIVANQLAQSAIIRWSVWFFSGLF
jgi:hypothetical protein